MSFGNPTLWTSPAARTRAPGQPSPPARARNTALRYKRPYSSVPPDTGSPALSSRHALMEKRRVSAPFNRRSQLSWLPPRNQIGMHNLAQTTVQQSVGPSAHAVFFPPPPKIQKACTILHNSPASDQAPAIEQVAFFQCTTRKLGLFRQNAHQAQNPAPRTQHPAPSTRRPFLPPPPKIEKACTILHNSPASHQTPVIAQVACYQCTTRKTGSVPSNCTSSPNPAPSTQDPAPAVN